MYKSRTILVWGTADQHLEENLKGNQKFSFDHSDYKTVTGPYRIIF